MAELKEVVSRCPTYEGLNLPLMLASPIEISTSLVLCKLTFEQP